MEEFRQKLYLFKVINILNLTMEIKINVNLIKNNSWIKKNEILLNIFEKS